MNISPMDIDICILGGGLVGATLALAICQNTPYTCTIIETQSQESLTQTRSVQHEQRSLVLTYKTLELLKQWRIVPQIHDKLSLIQRVDLVHWQAGKSNLPQLSLDHQQVRLPYLGGVIAATTLISDLHHQLNQTSSCFCFYQRHAESIEIDQQGFPVISLSSKDKLRAKLLIIAEGRQSPTADQLNIRYKERLYPQQVAVFHVKIQQDFSTKKKMRPKVHQDTHKAWWYSIPGGSLALVPRYQDSDIPVQSSQASQNQAILSYGAVLTLKNQLAEQWLAQSESQQLTELARYLPENMKLLSKTKAAIYPLRMTIAQELVRPHIVLSGNSAANLPPLGAQSLNLSFRLAERLIKLLKDIRLPLSWQTLHNLALAMEEDIRFTSQAVDYGIHYLDYLQYPLVNQLTGWGLRLMNKATPVKRILIQKALGF